MPTDPKIFEQIKELDDQIISMYGVRDANIKKMDIMYRLEMETPKNAPEGLKLSISPDARNTVQGVVRLMTSTAPHFSVPSAENSEGASAYSDTMELAAEAMWASSNQAQGSTIENDVCQSLTLYDEAYASVTCMSDVLAAKRQKKDKGPLSWLDDGAEDVAEEAPYLYTIIPPIEAYPLMGKYGMVAFVRRQNITGTELLSEYGEAARSIVKGAHRATAIEVREHWDSKYHAIYTRSGDVILSPVEHGLGMIPIAHRIANGTKLYKEPENQRQPMLLGLDKSGLWRDKNVVLTATMNKVRAFGLNAQFIFRQANSDQETPRLDFSENGGTLTVPPGGDLQQMNLAMIDNTTIGALNLLDGMIGDSTIYKQALGAPVNANNYSAASLLSQAGRLPLVPIQHAAEKMLADLMRITMKWIRFNGEKQKAYKQGESVEIDPAQIPARVLFNVSMDVDLPQDMLRNANIGTMLKNAGLVDDRWIHENILKVGQTTDMKKRIVAQQVSDLLIQDTVKKFVEQWQKQTAPKQPPAQQPPQGVGGQGYDPNAGGMPTVEANGMQQGDMAQSLPNGITPEMMIGGGGQ